VSSETYWNAIRRRVCRLCLDQGSDGTCYRGGGPCPIEVHLPRLVETLLTVGSYRMDEYVAAVEAEICSRCAERGEPEHCPTRERGDCALAMYLPLVLDAVEEVRSATAPAPVTASETTTPIP
jgi:hypothetical protein